MGNNYNFREKAAEIKFFNHSYEFNRFYNRHKSFCRQLFGISDLIVYRFGKEVRIPINRKNFYNGIKLTHAFIIDNLQYVKGNPQYYELQEMLEKLSDDFIDDDIYDKFSKIEKNQENLSFEDTTEYNRRYYNYVIRCVHIYIILIYSLQENLIMNFRNMKSIIYQDSRAFYEGLAFFRNDVANDIAGFTLEKLFNKVKIVLAYYYTYSVFLTNRQKIQIDNITEDLFNYITNEDTIKKITYIEKYSQDESKKKEYKQESKMVLKILIHIYKTVNDGLLDRNILPKPKPKELIDKTTI